MPKGRYSPTFRGKNPDPLSPSLNRPRPGPAPSLPQPPPPALMLHQRWPPAPHAEHPSASPAFGPSDHCHCLPPYGGRQGGRDSPGERQRASFKSRQAAGASNRTAGGNHKVSERGWLPPAARVATTRA